MGTLLEKANEILTEKTTKILSSNIKEGVTVFDVDGAYNGPRPTMYRYNTINDMNNSTGHEEGDIAIISSVEQQQFQRDSIVTNINCPPTVVVTEPVTQEYDDSIQWGLKPVDDSHISTYQGGGVLNKYFFTLDLMWMDEQGEHSAGFTYQSTDGITYTTGASRVLTVTFPEEFEFGALQFNTVQWDDRFSQFMYIGGSQEVINLYKYMNGSWTALGKWAN